MSISALSGLRCYLYQILNFRIYWELFLEFVIYCTCLCVYSCAGVTLLCHFFFRFFSTFYYTIFQTYIKVERILQWIPAYTPIRFYHFTILAISHVYPSVCPSVHSSIHLIFWCISRGVAGIITLPPNFNMHISLNYRGLVIYFAIWQG